MDVCRLVVKLVKAGLAMFFVAVTFHTLVALSGIATLVSWTQELVGYAVHSYAVLWLKCFNVVATMVFLIALLYVTKVIKKLNPFIPCQCVSCRNGDPGCEVDDYGRMKKTSSQLSVTPKPNPPLISFMRDFKNSVNLDALKPYLYENYVLTFEDGNEMKSTLHASDSQRVEQFLLIMNRKGSKVIEKLIQALENSVVDGNPSHDDLAELLKNNYCSERSSFSGCGDASHDQSETGDTADVESKMDEPHTPTLAATRMFSGGAVALQWPGLELHAFEDINLESGEAKVYNREQNGFKIYAPEMAVNSPTLMHVSVFTRGQLQLPERCELISAIYAICIYGKLAKPVTIEFEHCAVIKDKTDASYVRFVHAPFSEVPPYQFENLKKARANVESYVGEQSKYGSVTIPTKGSKEFCALLAVVQKRRSQMMKMISNDLQCRYRVQVFFEALAPPTEWLDEWRAHVVVFQDHEPWHKIFQDKYPTSKFLKYDEDLVVTFERETTVLLRAEQDEPSQASGNPGWRVLATSSTTLSRKEVDNCQGLLDSCQLSTCIFHLKWAQPPLPEASAAATAMADSSPSQQQERDCYPSEVYLRLEMKGARKPFDSSPKTSSRVDLLICFSPKRIANGLGQILSS